MKQNPAPAFNGLRSAADLAGLDGDLFEVATDIAMRLVVVDIKNHRERNTRSWFDPLLLPPGEVYFSGRSADVHGEVLAPTLIAEAIAGLYAALAAARDLPPPRRKVIADLQADLDVECARQFRRFPDPFPSAPLPHLLQCFADKLSRDFRMLGDDPGRSSNGRRREHLRRLLGHLPGSFARQLLHHAIPAAHQIYKHFSGYDQEKAATFSQQFNEMVQVQLMLVAQVHCSKAAAVSADAKLLRKTAFWGISNILLYFQGQILLFLLNWVRRAPGADRSSAKARASAAITAARFESEMWAFTPTPQKYGECIINTMDSRRRRAGALHLAQQIGTVSERAAAPFMH